MAKVQLSYSEAQKIVKEHLGLSDDFEVVIERKDAQKRRESISPHPPVRLV
jgi:hypothetical protein